MLGLPIVVLMFLTMAVLRRKNRLTFGLAAILGTVAMFGVLLGSAVSNGQTFVEAVIGAAVLAPIAGAVMFGLAKLAGLDESRS